MTNVTHAGQAPRRSLRRAALLGTSALALALTAAQVQAQCTPSAPNAALGAFSALNFGATSSGTVSAIQSVTSILNTTNTAFLSQTSAFVGAPANAFEGLNGGGVWARGIGGTFDTRTSGNYNFANVVAPGLINGNGGCNVRTFQDFGGVQAGADISRLNIGGGNFHFGVTAGYTDSTIRSPTGFNGGALNAQFQTPFVGVYGAFTKDGFFADGQIRMDFLQGRLSDPTNTGLFGQRLNARSLSFTGNVGKQFPLGDDWFVEPSLGGVYSTVSVDRFNISGTFIQANNLTGFSPPSIVKINDFESILGRASLRLGRNVILNNIALQPFVTASVFNEFAGNVRTSILSTFDPVFQVLTGSAPGAFSAFDNRVGVTSRRIGTYGQFSGGVAGQILNTGWLAYVRGDYRIGDRVDGWGVSGGVRYQFTPEQVIARGVVRKGYDAPGLLPVMDGPMNWTGLSAGGSIGGLIDTARQNYPFSVFGFGNATARPDSAGILAGGQVGADYQFGNLVLGVAGDFNWTNARGGRSCPTVVGIFFTCESNVDLLVSATGRVGFAADRSLFYIKGGYATADLSERLADNTAGQPIIAGGQFRQFRPVRNSSDGWTIGAGFEYALTKNWTAKAEYMHYDLGRRTALITDGVVNLRTPVRHEGDLVRVGVNYRFNFDPVPVAVVPVAAAPVVRKY